MLVTINDVTLRDGLQDEAVVVATADKVAIARSLANAGLSSVEIGSFVNPARVPQMQHSEDVISQTGDLPFERVALALNSRGVHRAVATGVEIIQVAVSASASHSSANAGREVRSAVDDITAAVSEHPDRRFIAAISTAFVCPFEGIVPMDKILELVAWLSSVQVERVSLADTLGTASPDHVASTVRAVTQAFPALTLGLHLHNAGGQALEAIDAALELGVRTFDSAVGGYGGCPFAPGAAGNLATELLAAHLDTHGVRTGLDVDLLNETRQLVQDSIARGVPVLAEPH